MAQENLGAEWDDYKEAWKFLKSSVKYEEYACVHIGTKIDSQYVLLYTYDYPRSIIDKYEWVIRWRRAKLQCQYPKQVIYSTTCYYDKKTAQNPKALELLNKMHNNLVQMKRKQRQLDEEEQRQKMTLFADYTKIDKYKSEIKRRISEFKKERCEYLKLKFVCPFDCNKAATL